MKLNEILTRRSYPGIGNEPIISYMYRKVGFFFSVLCVSLILYLSSIALIMIVPAYSFIFGYALLGGIGGILLLFMGIAVSEGWATSVLRYTPSATSYRKRQLLLSFVGVVAMSVLIIVVANQISLF